ncbi:hypothetical protein [Prosthecodimorpha staleyi]|uniref:Uncharacterized protein n=1 Tax=Prosthecodimorpha staleyi TaxID=2840188 RepID=A0A947GFU9_9HYPH|nr:hypothetical protein [Prosthecodimorpha staleyi]MBT9293301.1 hypothetical protein [Prosthecodimorpha staleyi]
MSLLCKLDHMRELASRLERHFPEMAHCIGQGCIAMSETIILSNQSTAEGRFRRQIATNQLKMLLRDIALLSATVQDHLNQGGNRVPVPLPAETVTR